MPHTSKEAFVVVGYTPTYQKEEMLLNLLRVLKQKNIPIVLVLHNIPSNQILEMVDYFIYDKENESLPTDKVHGYSFIYNKEGFGGTWDIRTTYDAFRINNHGLAAGRMHFLGLHLAKGLGFEKCQLMEYDTGLPNLNEIEENFKILDEYDCVAYNGFDDLNRYELIFCQFVAFNLKAYSLESFQYNNTNRKILLDIWQSKPSYNGIFECVYFDYFCKPYKYYMKNHERLHRENIIIDLSNKSAIPLKTHITPVYYSTDNSAKLFLSNDNSKTLETDIIVNDTIYIRKEILPNSWLLHDFSLDLEEIKTIKVFVDDKLLHVYKFQTEQDYINFKNRSVIIKK